LGFQTGPNGDFIPFVVVRGGLRARLARPIYYELAALAAEGQGVWSGGMFFPFPEDVQPG
jgi:hypothetical protein